MTQLTISLSLEAETGLRADAQAHHLPVEAMASEKLNGLYSDQRAARCKYERRRPGTVEGREAFEILAKEASEKMQEKHNLVQLP